MHERLMESIKRFEDGLTSEEEAGGRLAQFGSEILIHIDQVGYYGPDIMMFKGATLTGDRVLLLQHMHQLNLLLVALPKRGPTPRRIGFRNRSRDGDEP